MSEMLDRLKSGDFHVMHLRQLPDRSVVIRLEKRSAPTVRGRI